MCGTLSCKSFMADSAKFRNIFIKVRPQEWLCWIPCQFPAEKAPKNGNADLRNAPCCFPACSDFRCARCRLCNAASPIVGTEVSRHLPCVSRSYNTGFSRAVCCPFRQSPYSTTESPHPGGVRLASVFCRCPLIPLFCRCEKTTILLTMLRSHFGWVPDILYIFSALSQTFP